MQELICRTMKIPVAEVLGDDMRSDLYSSIRAAERICVAATNVALSYCATQDAESWGRDKIPKVPKLYSYPVVSGMFPAGCSSVAASISRAADTKYRQDRFAILTGRKSLPMQRSCPVPLHHNKSLKSIRLRLDNDRNVIATIRLFGRAFSMRLRGGSNYARVLCVIRAAVESDNIGDSKIWIGKRGDILLGIACKFPPNNTVNSGTMRVSTDRDYFVVASKEHSSIPFSITGDHVKRWIAERKRKQERLRQDSKSGSANSRLKSQRDLVSQKFHNRLRSFTQEASSHLVAHARRLRVAKIEYNATIRSYFGSAFPWFEFASVLRNKCEEFGVEFVELTNAIIPADEWEPHVYYAMPVIDNSPIGRVKIGITGRANGKRRRELENAGGHELVLLATEKLPKTKLRKRERELHAKFAKSKIDVGEEWFALEPVVSWLRESGCLGNSGNLSQLTQVLEV